MKKIFGSALLLAFFYYSGAQQCPQNILGTKTLYRPLQTSYHRPPAGYEPVFINHVSRHGARHLTKSPKATLADTLLRRAGKEGMLTPRGERLWRMVRALDSVEGHKAGWISHEGAVELGGIAERMYMNNKPVFIPGVVTRPIMVTKEIRTRQSADSFLVGLRKKYPLKDSVPLYTNDTLLRFYDLSSAYKDFEQAGSWCSYFASLQESLKFDSLAGVITQRFFKPAFMAELKRGDTTKFVNDIFGFLTIVPSLKKEISESGYSEKDLAFYSFFSCEEMSVLNKSGNAEDFLLKAGGTDSMGIQVRIAAPLLVDFITAIDTFLMTGKRPIALRFAHAETIAPFAALLNIDSASGPARSIIHFDKVWNAPRVAPLSANIQWIVYKNPKSKKYLVRILLNEKEVAINGLKTSSFPFYSWDAVRAFYIKKLSPLGCECGCLPGDDMYQCLQKLK